MVHLLGSYTPALLYISEAIGTVELTGFDIMPRIAPGQALRVDSETRRGGKIVSDTHAAICTLLQLQTDF